MKALVTQENVAAAAQAILDGGAEPTLIAVQKKIGGGSYTTVKRYLDAWLAEREEVRATVPIPETIQQQANTFIHKIWVAALAVGSKRIEQATAAAGEEIQTVHEALITMEAAQQGFVENLKEAKEENATLTVAVQQLEADLQTRTAQLQAVEQQNRQLQSDLMALRQQAMEHARMLGELDALRKQVHQQTVLIERLSGRP